MVSPDLTIPDNPDDFAIGDMVTIPGPDEKPVPGIAPAAKQQGRYVADSIKARLRGDTAVRPFHHHHDGSLAQIGKAPCRNRLWLDQAPRPSCMVVWGVAHIYFLVGVRSRLERVL